MERRRRLMPDYDLSEGVGAGGAGTRTSAPSLSVGPEEAALRWRLASCFFFFACSRWRFSNA
jgi:hypothetical protein